MSWIDPHELVPLRMEIVLRDHYCLRCLHIAQIGTTMRVVCKHLGREAFMTIAGQIEGHSENCFFPRCKYHDLFIPYDKEE
jgi:hypothetical protein